MSQIKNLAPDDMPREKLLTHGSKTLSNSELLAILIGSGSREHNAVELCQLILQDTYNDLDKLASLSISDLMQYKGIGEAKAITIISALELGRRRKNSEKTALKQISSSYDAYQLLHSTMMDLQHEEFWIFCLNRKNEVIKLAEISKGGREATVVDSKIIFKIGLDTRASGIILAHNHPSGNSEPSKQDIDLTKKIKEAGKVLDIAVLDHIIYTNNSYYSFADQNNI
jgi:DNA repair protein RadC